MASLCRIAGCRETWSVGQAASRTGSGELSGTKGSSLYPAANAAAAGIRSILEVRSPERRARASVWAWRRCRGAPDSGAKADDGRAELRATLSQNAAQIPPRPRSEQRERGDHDAQSAVPKRREGEHRRNGHGPAAVRSGAPNHNNQREGQPDGERNRDLSLI